MNEKSIHFITTGTTERVKELYEHFPFPHYPLWMPLKQSNGELGSSSFAARLFREKYEKLSAIDQPVEQFCPRDKTILIGGCGDTQPLVFRKVEPKDHKLLCVDISNANLERARKRLILRKGLTRFINSDLELFMAKEGKVAGPYDHIDLYGVLHHLADPTRVLSSLARSLHDQGTMRLMVYNSHARAWIRDWQSIFRLLRINYKDAKDILVAQDILKQAAQNLPRLESRLGRMSSLLAHPSRFVDCFLHEREASLSIQDWYRSIEDCGLEAVGLLDLYGELDDLPNPLWQVPQAEELSERAADFRYENNLVLYLAKPQIRHTAKSSKSKAVQHFTRRKKRSKTPPQSWFECPETKKLSFQFRKNIWHNYISEAESFKIDASKITQLKSLPIPSLQRLARMGAISQDTASKLGIREKLLAPMSHEMEKPEYGPAISDIRNSSLTRLIMNRLQNENIYSERRFFAIVERILRSQK